MGALLALVAMAFEKRWTYRKLASEAGTGVQAATRAYKAFEADQKLLQPAEPENEKPAESIGEANSQFLTDLIGNRGNSKGRSISGIPEPIDRATLELVTPLLETALKDVKSGRIRAKNANDIKTLIGLAKEALGLTAEKTSGRPVVNISLPSGTAEPRIVGESAVES